MKILIQLVGQHKALMDMANWRCKVCGYLFDEEEGHPSQNIPPGTRLEELPEDWVCPICGASKSEFEREE